MPDEKILKTDTSTTDSDETRQLHQVYDKFYKSIFSYKSQLKEFFEIFFPDLAKEIDFEKGEQLKTTFIKSDFQDREPEQLSFELEKIINDEALKKERARDVTYRNYEKTLTNKC